MNTLHTAFGVPVGYSDHTQGIEVSIAAVTLGAEVIEKHFTLDRNMEGPDHIASMEPYEFKTMVDAIRNIEIALGTGLKKPTDLENEISSVVQKRIVANKPILSGKILDEEDLCVKRSASGILAGNWDLVVGTIARKNYDVDEGICF